jgi:hypothetical protein
MIAAKNLRLGSTVQTGDEGFWRNPATTIIVDYLFSLVRRGGTKQRIRNYVSQQRDDQQVCD